jgi:hypothetical protein
MYAPPRVPPVPIADAPALSVRAAPPGLPQLVCTPRSPRAVPPPSDVDWFRTQLGAGALPPSRCYAMLCYAMLYYAVLCCAMLCYAVLCCATLCYAMLCYAILCYAMLRYAMLC